MNATSTTDGPVPIRYSTLPPLPLPDEDVELTWTQTLSRAYDLQQDAMRCACDWLRAGAPGRALEVLEANLK